MMLGYHDVRVDNEPDARLIRFTHQHLPKLLAKTRLQFDAFKDLLSAYANGKLSYTAFKAHVKQRVWGESEDVPEAFESEDF